MNEALSLTPEYALGHLVLARVQAFTNRALQAIAECERSLLLDRNLADQHVAIGWGECVLGRAEETDAYINEAFRLSLAIRTPIDGWRLQHSPNCFSGTTTRRLRCCDAL